MSTLIKRGSSAGSSGQPSSPAPATTPSAAVNSSSGGSTVTSPTITNPNGAKAKRLAREAEEKATREAKEEEMNVHSYNEMLKKCETPLCTAAQADIAASALGCSPRRVKLTVRFVCVHFASAE